MEHNQEFKSRHTHIWTTDFNKTANAILWKQESLSKKMMLEQFDSHIRQFFNPYLIPYI